jgi:hypothetical protein
MQPLPPLNNTATVSEPTQSSKQGQIASGNTQRILSELGRNLMEAKTQAEQLPPATEFSSFTLRPLLSNKEFELLHQQSHQQEEPAFKRVRLTSDESSETTPMAPPPIPSRTPLAPSFSKAGRDDTFFRTNSLALSDISAFGDEEESGLGTPMGYADYDFVNPFLDESDIASLTPPPSTVPNKVHPVPPPQRRLRNVSSDEGRGSEELLQTFGPLNEYNPVSPIHHPASPYRSPSPIETDPPMTDFNEGMKSVMDSLYADGDTVSSTQNSNFSGNNPSMPTLLMPWRGGTLKRRYSSNGKLANGNNMHRSMSIVNRVNGRQ